MNQSANPAHVEVEISTDEIRAQLERILGSSSFRNSKRHTRFLGYIFEKTISGKTRDMKERSIGIEVFDRTPDYDLANDAIVRVAAGDIRKRLAQYYADEAHRDELHVVLPSGSYIPVFLPPDLKKQLSESAQIERPELPGAPTHGPLIPRTEVSSPAEPMQSNSTKKIKWSFSLWVAGAVSIALLGAALAYETRPERAFNDFWNPILTGGQSVVFCIGDLNWMSHDDSDIMTEPLLQVMLHRNHVGPYDVGALARLSNFLGGHGKRSSVLLVDSSNLTNFRNQPSIFIGAFDNSWSPRILSGFRYQFKSDSSTNIGSVLDSQASKPLNWAIDFTKPLSAISRDYAIVARVKSSLTGQTDLVIAGIGPYGTTAASEFVSNPKYFSQFVSQAPKHWDQRDIEIVLSTDVVNGRSGPPQMLTFDVR